MTIKYSPIVYVVRTCTTVTGYMHPKKLAATALSTTTIDGTNLYYTLITEWGIIENQV